jgi:DNA-binding FrmR family transcriptional regulator
MASHKRPEVEKRLSRIEGHVRSIHRMLEDGRSYPEIVQQISAVKAALDSVVQVIVDDLVEDCAKNATKNPNVNRSLLELQEVVARSR